MRLFVGTAVLTTMLAVGQQSATAGTATQTGVEYTVKVQTGNVRHAGTNANVYVDIHGSLDDSGMLLMDNINNNFERGELDTFEFVLDDLGTITQVCVERDNRGVAPGWNLSWISVNGADFPFNEWIDADEQICNN